MRIGFIIFCVLLIIRISSAQEVLNYKTFLTMVAENHPVARQAQFITQRGDWELTRGRGFLDPKLVSTYDTKDFKEKDYYDLWNSYLSIPTPLNFELKTGYERNSGVFLNRQNDVPNDGLFYAGISVPVGRGLFLSNQVFERNAGKFQSEQLKIQANVIMNNLLLDASMTYLAWHESIMKTKVYRNAVETSRVTFSGVRESFINGDRAAMDTTESLIQVQLLQNALDKSELDSTNQLLMMNNFLWTTQLTKEIYPDSILMVELGSLSKFESFTIQNHPELKNLTNKQAQLKNEKRFYAEQVKPQLDVNYNFLIENGYGKEFNTQDFKAGVSFYLPLFLRKERAKLQATKLKLSETEMKTKQKQQEVINKVRASYNKVFTTAQLLQRQLSITENYQTLLVGEHQKFANGESSIFYVNVRQNKLLQAEIKLIELQIQYQVYLIILYWNSGMIQGLLQ